MVGADPLRRLPRLLRAASTAASWARELQGTSDQARGRCAGEPTVHGDERGFFVETFRESELAVWVSTPSSSRTITAARAPRCCAACTARPARPSWFAAPAVDLGRGRRPAPRVAHLQAVGGLRAERDQPPQLFIPDGFGHGFCVLSDSADVLYRVSSYYDPERETGSPGTTPRSASSGRSQTQCSPSATHRRRVSPTLRPDPALRGDYGRTVRGRPIRWPL